jgi:predicted N-acyltransferase
VAYASFEDFLSDLQQAKRKKIRQERRKVHDAGVSIAPLVGNDITTQDWDFFYRCYEQTYEEHGNAPYLTRSFFHMLAQQQPGHWVMFVARNASGPMACSLIAFDEGTSTPLAWGRYWGALQRVDSLHFEMCYYAPLQWSIERKLAVFEGGAQGEHKLARALTPVQTYSAHWIRDERFAAAIEQYLQREMQGMDQYYEELCQHTPLRVRQA